MLRLPRGGIGLLHGLLAAFTALMPDGHRIAELRRHLRHGLVQDARALRATDHQHANRPLTAYQTLPRQRQRQHIGAHRIPDDVRMRKGAGKRLHHFLRNLRQPFVGQAGNAVLFVEDHRDPQRPRRQAARPGHIAAHTQHHVRLETLHDRPRLTPGVEDPHRRQQLCFNPFATQAGDTDKINLDAVFRH